MARRPAVTHYDVSFQNIPVRVGDMSATRVPVDKQVYNYLGADVMDELEYKGADHAVRLSLVYGTDWRAVHSPLSCLPQQGWHVDDRRLVDITAPAGCPHPGPLHGQLLLGHRGDQHTVVLYVFAHRGGTTGDWLKQGWAVSQSPPGTGGLMLSLSTFHAPGAAAAAEKLLREVLTSVYLPAVGFWYR